MARSGWFVGSAKITLSALSLALTFAAVAAACGGATANELTDVLPDGADGGSSGSSGGSSGSSGGSSGSSGGSSGSSGGSSGSSGASSSSGDLPPVDAGPAADAALDSGAAVDAGPSNPGKITCGTETCDAKGEICCVRANGSTCVDENQGCQGGVRQACDERADCDGNSVCCLELREGAARCRRTCEGSLSITVCKTDGDCSGGVKCTQQNCFGRSVSACGRITGCT